MPEPTRYRLGAAAVIQNEQSRVLLVKHTYGHLNWELPGGGAEIGESIVETVVREVREETGLIVVAQHTTGVYYEPENDLLHFVFLCHPQPASLNKIHLDNKEISQYGYWSPDALPRPISDFTVLRITDAISGVRLPLPKVITPRQWFY
jgi:8-oxo-dGTP pyrophosphatase MutT (NUDIX family)